MFWRCLLLLTLLGRLFGDLRLSSSAEGTLSLSPTLSLVGACGSTGGRVQRCPGGGGAHGAVPRPSRVRADTAERPWRGAGHGDHRGAQRSVERPAIIEVRRDPLKGQGSQRSVEMPPSRCGRAPRLVAERLVGTAQRTRRDRSNRIMLEQGGGPGLAAHGKRVETRKIGHERGKKKKQALNCLPVVFLNSSHFFHPASAAPALADRQRAGGHLRAAKHLAGLARTRGDYEGHRRAPHPWHLY